MSNRFNASYFAPIRLKILEILINFLTDYRKVKKVKLLDMTKEANRPFYH